MLELFFYSCNVFILSSLLLLEENLNLYMLENVRQFFYWQHLSEKDIFSLKLTLSNI